MLCIFQRCQPFFYLLHWKTRRVKENMDALNTKQLASNWLALNKHLITSQIWSICKITLESFSSCLLEYFTLRYITNSQACHKEMNQINSSTKYPPQQQWCRDTICWLLYTNSVIECRCKTINHLFMTLSTGSVVELFTADAVCVLGGRRMLLLLGPITLNLCCCRTLLHYIITL